MYLYIFSLVEDLGANIPGEDVLEDVIENQQDGDNAKIEDPATKTIDEDQNPKIERVQRRRRRPKTKRR